MKDAAAVAKSTTSRRAVRLAACLFSALLLLVVGAASASAAAPPNDAFADASPLSFGHAAVDGTTAGATAEPDEPGHASSTPALNSVWYRFSSPSRRSAVLRVCGTATDPVVAVYAGDALGSLTRVK